MRNWRIASVSALAVIVVSIPLYVFLETQRRAVNETAGEEAVATFVGRDECIDCHTEAYESWLGSHHDDAMDHANEDTVLGDFDNAEFEYKGITSRFYR